MLLFVNIDEHSIEEFNRRNLIEVKKNLKTYLAQPEDIIIKKMIYYNKGG